MEKEIFKNIVGYDGIYQISTLGNVKRLQRKVRNNKNGGKRVLKEIILKPKTKKQGYQEVNLLGKMFYVHRLVAETFLGKISKEKCVNHLDGNKKNNNIKNLEIVSFRENSKHAFINGFLVPKSFKGEEHPRAKIKNKDAINIRNMYINGYDYFYIKRNYPDIPTSTLRKIMYGTTWKSITCA